MRDGTAFCHLAGCEVSTWSEEWRHEREVAAVLAIALMGALVCCP